MLDKSKITVQYGEVFEEVNADGLDGKEFKEIRVHQRLCFANSLIYGARLKMRFFT